MKKIFTRTPMHGDLYFKSIYDYFDGPKIFSVITKKGSVLLIYWTDESEVSLSWVGIEISKKRLLALESKSIDIYTVLSEKESGYYFSIETFFDKNELPNYNFKLGDIKNEIIMPDKEINIDFVERIITDEEVSILEQSSRENADYSIHIGKPKKSKGIIDFNKVIPVFDIINELYTDFISAYKLHDKLIPVSAQPGSFMLDFNAEKFNFLEKELSILSSLIKNRKDIRDLIVDRKISPQSIEKLFNHIANEDLVIDLSNKNIKSDFFNINKIDAEFYLKEINKLSLMNLSSSQIPQADDIYKIFELVKNINENGFLNREKVNLSPRHILYYSEAARILGFVSSSGSLTSVGQQLMMSSPDKKLSIAAQSFENSYCGWRWVIWSKAENITQIDPESSKAFLDECSFTLSESTKTRRARTLKKWCNELQDSYKVWE